MMLHEPAAQSGKDLASPYKMRLGVRMFTLYASIYFIGFVGINVVQPKLMEKIVFMGMNLAIVFGMGLIVFALILALIYNHQCTQKEKEMNKAGADKGDE